MKRGLAVLLLAVLSGCGGGDHATSASAENQVPAVAGTYSGPLAWTVDGQPFRTLQMTLHVAQTGSQLTITGTLSISGQSVPFESATGSIDAAGYFTSSTLGGAMSMTSDECDPFGRRIAEVLRPDGGVGRTRHVAVLRQLDLLRHSDEMRPRSLQP